MSTKLKVMWGINILILVLSIIFLSIWFPIRNQVISVYAVQQLNSSIFNYSLIQMVIGGIIERSIITFNVVFTLILSILSIKN
jgi:hypothetical protein